MESFCIDSRRAGNRILRVSSPLRKRWLLVSLIASAGLVAEPVPPTYFVEESHAVVVGRLVDIRVTHNGEEQGTGRVIAEAVIAGPVKRHDGFPLEWRYSSELARMCPPALDIKLLPGKRPSGSSSSHQTEPPDHPPGLGPRGHERDRESDQRALAIFRQRFAANESGALRFRR